MPSRRESIFYCGLFTKSGGPLQSIQFSPLVFFTLCISKGNYYILRIGVVGKCHKIGLMCKCQKYQNLTKI